MKKILLRLCRLNSQSNKSISILSSAIFIFVLFGIYMAEAASTYYLDNKNGSDGYDGLAMTHANGHGPWKNASSVNSHAFVGGDKILIARGTTINVIGTPTNTNGFSGILAPSRSLTDKSNSQITIDAYDPPGTSGLRKPIIDAQKGASSPRNWIAAILLYNQDYWTIQNIAVTNNITNPHSDGSDQGFRWGILVYYPATSSNTQRHNITIANDTIYDVYGSNFKASSADGAVEMYMVGGIYVWVAAGVTTSFNSSSTLPNNHIDNVLIQNNKIKNITGEGILFRGEGIWDGDKDVMNWNNLSTNIVIRGDTVTNVCDGIQAIGTDNVLIEYNVVDGAGVTGTMDPLTAQPNPSKYPPGGDPAPWDPTKYTGAVSGIWTQCSRGGRIQYNEVRNTKLLPGDGEALNRDIIQDSICIFQYNYTHANEGGFFMECGPRLSTEYPDPPNTYSIVRYNVSQNDGNCTLIDPNPLDAGKFINTSRDGGQYYNNSFYCNLSCSFNLLVWSSNNNFFNNIFDGPTFSITNDPNYINNYFYSNCYTFSSYPPSDAYALVMNPLFINGGQAGNGISSAQQCYKLTPSSPCIGTGMGISNNGGLDFWGNPLHYDNPERGAYELDQGDMAMEKILSSGKLICFLRKSNKNLYYMIQTTAGDNNIWPSTWSSLGGPALGSIAAIKGWSDHALYVFAKDNNNTLRYRCLPSNSNTWADWKPLPTSITGGGNNFKVGSKIAVDTFSDNRIAVFAKGDDDHLYYLKQTGSNTFSPSWTSLSTNTAVGDKIAISLDNGGKMQVFANSTSNQVLGQSQTAKGSNGPWNADFFYYSAHSGVDASGGLAVAMNQNKALQVFAASANSQKISTMYQDPANLFNWTSWTDIATTPVQNIMAGVNSDGRLELFFWGYHRMLDHIWQNGVNGYTSWYSPGNYMGVQETQQGLGGNYIGVINNNASTWNLSVFLLNDKTPQGTGLYSVGYLYQNTSITGYWSSVYWFSDN